MRKLFFTSADFDSITPWVLLSSAVFIGLSLLVANQTDLLLSSMENHFAEKDSRIEIHLASPATAPLPTKPAWNVHTLDKGIRASTIHTVPNKESNYALKKQELAEYLVQWQNTILKFASKQLSSKKIPIGTVVVSVVVSHSGQLISVHCHSNNQALVTAIHQIILAAAPFPRLPSAWQNPPQNLRIVRTWTFN